MPEESEVFVAADSTDKENGCLSCFKTVREMIPDFSSDEELGIALDDSPKKKGISPKKNKEEGAKAFGQSNSKKAKLVGLGVGKKFGAPTMCAFLILGIFLILLGSAMLAATRLAQQRTQDAVRLTDDVIYEIISGINSNILDLPEVIIDALDQGVDTARDASIQVIDTGLVTLTSAANGVVDLVNDIGFSFNTIPGVNVPYSVPLISFPGINFGVWNTTQILPGSYLNDLNFSEFMIPNPPFLLIDLLDEPMDRTYSVFENTFIVVLTLGVVSLVISMCILVAGGIEPFIPAWVSAVGEFFLSIKRKSFWIPLACGIILILFTSLLFSINKESERRINSGIARADDEIRSLIESINSLNLDIPNAVEDSVSEGVSLLNQFVFGELNAATAQLSDRIRTLTDVIQSVFNTAASAAGIPQVFTFFFGIPAVNIQIPNPNIDLPALTFPEIPPDLIRLSDTVLPVMQEGVDAGFFLIYLLFSISALLICVPCWIVSFRTCYVYWEKKESKDEF